MLQEPDSARTVSAKLSARSLSASRIPGDKDVWFLIIAEMMMFGVFFITYMVYRAKDVELFNVSQLALNRNLALLNTLFLVTSSWTVAQAVIAARQDRLIAVRGYLLTAIGLAVAFMTAKCFRILDRVRAWDYSRDQYVLYVLFLPDDDPYASRDHRYGHSRRCMGECTPRSLPARQDGGPGDGRVLLAHGRPSLDIPLSVALPFEVTCMIDFLRSRIHRSWLFLMVATAATFGLRTEGAAGLGAAEATLGIAYMKGRLVILNFMEVRHAPLWLRLVLEAWLLAVSVTLLTIYWISVGRHA